MKGYNSIMMRETNIAARRSSQPYAGKAQAIENLGGSPALYEKHLARFKKNYAHAYVSIQEYLDTDHKKEAQRFAHSIKGLAGMLGLTYLARSAEALEMALGSNAKDLSAELSVFQKRLEEIVEH